MEETQKHVWQRSSACSGGNCVEVAEVPGGVLLRDSKNPDVAPFAFSAEEWNAFLAGAANGEFRFH